MKHIISIGLDQFIEIEYTPGGSCSMTSVGLKCDEREAVSERNFEALPAYNGAIDGLEALILAQACEGIDITTDAYKRAVISAIEGIDNNFG
ncbi:hypothetical protein DSM106972_096710 [Dulcicalothrix desertica PCC 7102]|uniref:Uncharacterized protein n=2 Tax=Dulcicalothrix desertica TaxID=32056 RepID=A0A3S1AJ49_9CYAN|nr:hypothetical protein DSM106972_096710 [Dulcicalothrix desertica PCC 7102]TWH62774.1 hypothetical protein CAL7102_00297 [Dulcicalothrix desertica PCC 7102]